MQSSYVTSKEAVRRFLLETQYLLPEEDQENSVIQMIRNLECVQLDPVASVERNQHLVLMARVPDYQPDMLHQLLAKGNCLNTGQMLHVRYLCKITLYLKRYVLV
ncbi:hypothetical protein D1864_09120 [Oceanobacillus picturae]|nr:hypothetical protein D1864_09120 [Oceanobacillus picturae]